MSLRVQDLTVYYQTLRGDVHALEGATFSVADKEIMGLAGESGCGKTTLGQSLIFLNAPMKLVIGRVTLDNEENGRLPVQESLHCPAIRYECNESNAKDRENGG
jgi:peptide/nickel transport system ATP-binding protein